MKILALDISTKTGWALLEGSMGAQPVVVSHGHACSGATVEKLSSDPYPKNYIYTTNYVTGLIMVRYDQFLPDVVVIEETNKSKARYSQKLLEWLHLNTLNQIYRHAHQCPIVYINTSDWRAANGIYMGKEDKKNNSKVNKAKRQGVSKKDLGLKGKITRKHLAVRAVKDKFGIEFKQKENDVAEAILLGTAYFLGAPHCNGK